MQLDLLVEAFKKCLELWGVNSSLNVSKTSILQDIKLIRGETTKQREVAEIKLNGGIIVQVKNRQNEFVERYNVLKIQFHGFWEGVNNPGFENTRKMGGEGWRQEMGGESPVVKIIAMDGRVIDSFNFFCFEELSEVVHAIQKEMKLSAKTVQVTVDLEMIRSVLEYLRIYVSGRRVANKSEVLSLISRLDQIVSSVRS